MNIIFFLNMDNLYFLPNNILRKLFKELKKYLGKNYTMHLNVYILSIFMHMYEVTN